MPKDKFSVFATCNIGQEALNRLTEQGYELEIFNSTTPPSKELILEKVFSGVDVLITTLRDSIDKEVLEAGKQTLKLIAQDAVGFDNIDRDTANKYKIPFTNTSEVLTEATAEFAFLMLGCASRKLYSSERLVRELQWETWHPSLPFLGDEVTGKTVAVIGTGRIGQAFIKKCMGFDMDVLCYDPIFQDHNFIESFCKLADLKFELGFSNRLLTIRYTNFGDALRNADYVSLHVPLTSKTRHLINSNSLEQMRSTAFLINTSRGSVVDEQALCLALKSNEIAGAALDVFEEEPLPVDSPLRDPELEDRLRLFHHFASAGRQTRLSPNPELGMAGRCVQGVIDVLEGHYNGNPSLMPYVVNKEAFEDV